MFARAVVVIDCHQLGMGQAVLIARAPYRTLAVPRISTSWKRFAR